MVRRFAATLAAVAMVGAMFVAVATLALVSCSTIGEDAPATPRSTAATAATTTTTATTAATGPFGTPPRMSITSTTVR